MFIIINGIGSIQVLGQSEFFNIFVYSGVVISLKQLIKECKSILILSKSGHKLGDTPNML